MHFRNPPSPFSQRELHLSHQASLQWSLHPLRFPRFRGTETFLTLKEGSTAHLGLLPSGKKREPALQCCICPPCPSPAGGSLTHSQALALSKRARDVTALRCSEPLRFMVVGPSKVCAVLCGMGPPGERWIGLLKCWFCGNLLITCRFFVNFLVVSRKKRNFGGRMLN